MGLRLARARQQKAFHTGPSYGAVSRKISCLVWIIIGRQTAKAVCVRCACGVRARRPPSETRRRVCHVSSGNQHRSSKKDSSVGGRVRAVREGAVRAVRCCEASVKARYLHGVSARHRSWYESGSSSASKGGRAGGRCRAGGRWAGPTFWNARRCVLHIHARRKTPCQAARSPAAVGAGWTQWLGGQGQGCGAALGERAKG